MKLIANLTAAILAASLPSRERGLKLDGTIHLFSETAGAPVAGAWIETRHHQQGEGGRMRSLPSRERGLKHLEQVNLRTFQRRSPRGSVD